MKIPFKKKDEVFPGGSVLKSPRGNTEEMGSIPGSEGFPCAALSLCSKSQEPQHWAHMMQLPKPMCPRAHAPQQEKPLQWEPPHCN